MLLNGASAPYRDPSEILLRRSRNRPGCWTIIGRSEARAASLTGAIRASPPPRTHLPRNGRGIKCRVVAPVPLPWVACPRSRERPPGFQTDAASSSDLRDWNLGADASPVLDHSPSQILCERRVADDVL